MTSFLKLGGVAIFFLALAIIPFYIPLFEGFGALQWDAREVHLTNLIFSSRAWHEGFAPLWTPYIFAGFPQIADLQVAVFYPVNMLMGLFGVFNQKMLMWQLVFHFALAGFGMCLLMRHLTKSTLAGVFSGIAYMFSGFMLGHASHVGMQNTAAWLPIVFLLAHIAFERKSWFFASGAGLAAGIGILAGHFQTSVFLLFAVGLYFAFDFGLGWYRAKMPPWKHIPLFAVIGVIAFLISATQLVPTFELTAQSQRVAIPLELAQTESLAPSSLWGLIAQNYKHVAYGNYTGPWDRTQNLLFFGITTLGFALAALLAQVRKVRFPLTLFFAGLAAVALLYALGKYGFLHKYFYLLPLFDKMRAPSNMILVFDFAVVVLAGFGFSFIRTAFRHLHFIGYVAVLVVALELVPTAVFTELTYARKEPETIFEKPWIVKNTEFEYSQLDPLLQFRLWRVSELDRNLAQVFRIRDFAGYNPLVYQRQAMYEDAMVRDPAFMDLAGIKYVPCEYISARAASLRKVGNLCINDGYFPRAYLVDSFAVAKDAEEVIPLMHEQDVRHTVVLEKDPRLERREETLAGTVGIQEYRDPNRFDVLVRSNKPALLFVNETYYPGWIALVDGKQTELFRANYLFRAVTVPEGEHVVRFVFSSPSLKRGFALSMIGVIVCMGIFGYALYRKIFHET